MRHRCGISRNDVLLYDGLIAVQLAGSIPVLVCYEWLKNEATVRAYPYMGADSRLTNFPTGHYGSRP
jgi:hypothetical protein